jgi:hypothetical protein
MFGITFNNEINIHGQGEILLKCSTYQYGGNITVIHVKKFQKISSIF